MEMDVPQDIRAPDSATLDLYCDRVASAVGRLSVRVFGLAHDDGILLAHHLGRALQLTNILRDLDEDASVDRLYLPVEALRAAGISAPEPFPAINDPNIEKVCLAVAARAEGHFKSASEIFARTPPKIARTPRIMGEAYRYILDRLYARGWTAPRAPLKLGKLKLVLIVARCFLA
jgi:presqualene diphosphate synthase